MSDWFSRIFVNDVVAMFANIQIFRNSVARNTTNLTNVFGVMRLGPVSLFIDSGHHVIATAIAIAPFTLFLPMVAMDDSSWNWCRSCARPEATDRIHPPRSRQVSSTRWRGKTVRPLHCELNKMPGGALRNLFENFISYYVGQVFLTCGLLETPWLAFFNSHNSVSGCLHPACSVSGSEVKATRIGGRPKPRQIKAIDMLMSAIIGHPYIFSTSKMIADNDDDDRIRETTMI